MHFMLKIESLSNVHTIFSHSYIIHHKQIRGVKLAFLQFVNQAKLEVISLPKALRKNLSFVRSFLLVKILICIHFF